MKRILMLGLVLALLATMIITTATFACGAGDGAQARNGASAQYAGDNGAHDGTGPNETCLNLHDDGQCGKP